MEKRTHSCGSLTKQDISKEVVLYGWAQRFRDHGGKKFIDLRDREGLTQVVFDPQDTKNFEKAESIKKEYLIAIKGIVRHRPEGTVNPKMKTGEIEVLVKSFETISEAEPLPFEIDDEHFKNVSEDVRLKYRYLDLRRKEMYNTFYLRSKFFKSLRDYMDEDGFIEVETPLLTRSTPEGARDILVPSRKHKGNFYALPQSPQLFKQLLMVAGFEKYFQIAKCFRDEDSRKDRQLEFTQLDLEASFISDEELFSIIENLIKKSFEETFGIKINTPFERIPYFESMNKYGSDKPDLRIIGLELKDISDIAKGSNFSVFTDVVKKGGLVKGLNVKNGVEKLSRKEIDKLIEFIKEQGGKGLAWIKVVDEKLESSITKFFKEDELEKIKERLEAENNDLLLFVADTWEKTNDLLDALRRHLADKLDLINRDEHKLIWILDFPMFHWNEEEQVIESEHNPFTMCREEHINTILSIKNQEDAIKRKDELIKVTSDCYDLVYNGSEIASGARRINLPKIQSKVFSIIGLKEEEIREKFGWFIDAYNYSAPPHRGIALGLDRIITMVLNKDSIREVIAFPKNKVGFDPLTNAPSKVDDYQLKELGIKTIVGNKEKKINVKFPEENY